VLHDDSELHDILNHQFYLRGMSEFGYDCRFRPHLWKVWIGLTIGLLGLLCGFGAANFKLRQDRRSNESVAIAYCGRSGKVAILCPGYGGLGVRPGGDGILIYKFV
jgi:hypothetical protein